jgi:hypothetical protein
MDNPPSMAGVSKMRCTPSAVMRNLAASVAVNRTPRERTPSCNVFIAAVASFNLMKSGPDNHVPPRFASSRYVSGSSSNVAYSSGEKRAAWVNATCVMDAARTRIFAAFSTERKYGASHDVDPDTCHRDGEQQSA